MATKTVLLAIGVTILVLISPSYAQQIPTTPTTSPCTASMLSSFTPCMNFLTNSSSSSGNSPTGECCNSLKSLMSNGANCLCQILTAGVPFKIPVNRTLAISLPKACKQPGVPVQCKASAGAPLPAPGPTAFGPSASPGPSGTIPAADTPALAPVSDTTPDITPSSTIPGSETPASTTGTGGSTLTPSSAMPSLSFSPSFLFSMAIMVIIKCF